MSSAPRGLAPREGLELESMKMGHAGPRLKPRRRPQAGKSGDPHSQNTDNSDYLPLSKDEVSLGDEDFIVPEEPFKQERLSAS